MQPGNATVLPRTLTQLGLARSRLRGVHAGGLVQPCPSRVQQFLPRIGADACAQPRSCLSVSNTRVDGGARRLDFGRNVVSSSTLHRQCRTCEVLSGGEAAVDSGAASVACPRSNRLRFVIRECVAQSAAGCCPQRIRVSSVSARLPFDRSNLRPLTNSARGLSTSVTVQGRSFRQQPQSVSRSHTASSQSRRIWVVVAQATGALQQHRRL